jgi:hypothetical protein
MPKSELALRAIGNIRWLTLGARPPGRISWVDVVWESVIAPGTAFFAVVNKDHARRLKHPPCDKWNAMKRAIRLAVFDKCRIEPPHLLKREGFSSHHRSFVMARSGAVAVILRRLVMDSNLLVADDLKGVNLFVRRGARELGRYGPQIIRGDTIESPIHWRAFIRRTSSQTANAQYSSHEVSAPHRPNETKLSDR